ncbi:hypothetical protein FRC06_008904 [Ceratobasidium sp. 370]|nr:hypothetical protein FRC06_008904 [Ceratobasidium sp. 370]
MAERAHPDAIERESSSTPSADPQHGSEAAAQSANSNSQQVVIGPAEALEYIRALSDPNQALSTLSQFWNVIPQGNPLEPLVFNLYRELRQRCRDTTPSIGDESWKQSNLWTRIGLLAVLYMHRYQQGWALADMQHSINCFEEAISILPADARQKPVILSNYANTLLWRFERQGDPSDLDKSVLVQRSAIESTPPNDSQLFLRIRSLAAALQVRFDHRGQLSDLEEAIPAIKRAIDVAPENHPYQALFVGDLGTILRNRFSRLAYLQDLDDAITNHKNALSLTPDSDPLRAGRINDLGMSFSVRFNRFGTVSDLNEALSCYEQSVISTPDTDIDKPVRLNNLGSALRDRFLRLGAMSDLQAALSYLERAVELTPDANPKKPRMLRALGGTLVTRFENRRSFEDIDRAITTQLRAISLCPTGHADRAWMLDALGVFLVTKFLHNGDLASLEQGIEVQEQAVSLTSSDNLDRAHFLSDLGSSLMRRFEWLNKLPDIERAISSHCQAVDMTPDDHEQKPRRLNNLASALCRKFVSFGNFHELERAIINCEQAVSLTRDDHPDKPIWVNNLGSILSTRFDDTGKLVYLDQAISYQNKSLEISAEGRPEKAMWLSNLAKSLLSRFELLKDLADLDRSISNRRLAVSLMLDGHPSLPMLLTSLGSAIRVRFEEFKKPEDLEEAVSVLREAVSLTPSDHPNRPDRLSNLGNSLVNRYHHSRQPADLEEALSSYRLAVQLTDEGSRQRPVWMAHLGWALCINFTISKKISDLEEAISVQEEAISLMLDTHPEKSKHLKRLAQSLALKAETLPDRRTRSSDEHILNTYFHSFRLASGAPIARLRAMTELADVADNLGFPDQSMRAYRLAMDYVPSVVWLGTTIGRRYQAMAGVLQDFVTKAAAQAFRVGDAGLALQLLEQGRSVVWGQILKLRTPVDDLREVNTALADRLEEVALAIDHIGTRLDRDGITSSYDEAVQTHHRLAEEWDELVERARKTLGFEKFLKPLEFTTLLRASHSSAVALINVSKRRCDAVILRPGTASWIHVELPFFSHQIATAMRQQWAQSLRSSGVRERGFKKDTSRTPSAKSQLEAVLLGLWSFIVQPILHQLGYLVSITAPSESNYLTVCKQVPRHSGNELPRMTWCATGPLSFLPLHAAGNYTPNGPPGKVFDYVISSYAPTLGSLLTKPPPTGDFQGILAVGQSNTRGMSSLPGTTRELDHIAQQAGGLRFTRLEGSQATHAAVLDGMHDHSWVHLACHASQNLDDPTSSVFYLHDKVLDLATISQAPFKHAGLAFLSACQTAAGVENLSEEAAHLAAGMLMSGFPSVIATMWSVRDQDAPVVAEQVYARLLKDGVASTANASRALHEAVGYLREHIGEDKFEAWVPYIYIGL